MAFRKKGDPVLAYKPDLLVVSECEQPEKLNIDANIPNCSSHFWLGDNPHKGVGIFTFSDQVLTLQPEYNPEFKYVIPLCVKGKTELLLFAIWTMSHPIRAKSYVGQIWGALQYYEKLINEDSFFIGDFNSNLIWDHERKGGNHSHVVDFLSERNIVSLYHTIRNEKQGEEKEPTLYLLKKKYKSYHMDYCFLSKNKIQKETKIEIGKYEDWIKYSDHMPMIMEGIKE